MLTPNSWSLVFTISANFDYGEEVHESINLGEWSTVIGYEMGSPQTTLYTTANTSLGGEL
jgi:hypothetical protein